MAKRKIIPIAEAMKKIMESDEELSGAESFHTDEEGYFDDWQCPFTDSSDDDDDITYTPQKSQRRGTPPHLRKLESPRKSENPRPKVKRPRSRSPHPSTPEQPWKTHTDPDVGPKLPRFVPARPPGVQLDKSKVYSPLDLFQLFFNNNVVRQLCSNTNKQARKRLAQGLQFKWVDVTPPEFLKYISLVIFMGLLKLGSVKAYWRQKNIFSVPFPRTVMPRDRWLFISSNIHMSDPAEDSVNDRKKGTPDYDPLFRLKPLMDEIKAACKSFYQPKKNLSIDERMVATKAKTGMTQYMKDKPTKWGFKLFILADSANGYTSNFNVYTGNAKSQTTSGHSYDAVVALLDKPILGCGYHIYCDNFYTSPKLFQHLSSLNFGACGTYREGRKDTPKSTVNAISKKSQRGSIRWIRDGNLLFVKWMDAREVSICSTIHQAYTSGEVTRRQKKRDGTWEFISIPVPTPILEYNKNMGGVDLSDQLIQYTTAHHKVMRWYKTMFLHFVDIAACNSYILHKELCAEQETNPLTHRAFMEELSAQLARVPLETQFPEITMVANKKTEHIPVPIAPLDPDKPEHRPADVRKYCEHCKVGKGYNKTPWQCGACKVPLCNFLERPCFAQWHS
ncbi:piggyBac transposable element-derived protein 4-like isoform X1 [Micropterus dolomieu]|uniref:piggyBac transposable element-derived protein 4-like isoform X1 n=1 Tax=Micropterus dolomieu TaxID=147949 RepID=UPI001E8DBDB1|nr:piggyBac transposable element-derived protein 4-like isoform X1 [Micropterus dolomieu]